MGLTVISFQATKCTNVEKKFRAKTKEFFQSIHIETMTEKKRINILLILFQFPVILNMSYLFHNSEIYVLKSVFMQL